MELSSGELYDLLRRFPSFELSYETIAHKKVSSHYEMALAIPAGRKYYLWFTFCRDRDVCYLMELNKDKRIIRASVVSPLHCDSAHTYAFRPGCYRNTLVYGTLVREEGAVPYFVVEDMYYYKGIPLKHLFFCDKLACWKQWFDVDREKLPAGLGDRRLDGDPIVSVHFPFLWKVSPHTPPFASLPTSLSGKIPYTVHHIQYRDAYRIAPYLNAPLGLDGGILSPPRERPVSTETRVAKFVPDFTKPQYRYASVFRVMADIQFDVYHLYAYGPGGKYVYYDVAYIPNFEKSVFLNGIFRNIRENRNLDYIEESDDEDDFEDTRADKYVDLQKEVWMECSFHPKFKRWIPNRVVDRMAKVVPIHKLAR